MGSSLNDWNFHLNHVGYKVGIGRNADFNEVTFI